MKGASCFHATLLFHVLSLPLSLQLHEFVLQLEKQAKDLDDEGDSAPMNPFNLTFIPSPDKDQGLGSFDLEAEYVTERQRHIAQEVKIPIVLSILFFLFDSIIQYLVLYPTFNQSIVIPLFVVRYCPMVLMWCCCSV